MQEWRDEAPDGGLTLLSTGAPRLVFRKIGEISGVYSLSMQLSQYN